MGIGKEDFDYSHPSNLLFSETKAKLLRPLLRNIAAPLRVYVL